MVWGSFFFRYPPGKVHCLHLKMMLSFLNIKFKTDENGIIEKQKNKNEEKQKIFAYNKKKNNNNEIGKRNSVIKYWIEKR